MAKVFRSFFWLGLGIVALPCSARDITGIEYFQGAEVVAGEVLARFDDLTAKSLAAIKAAEDVDYAEPVGSTGALLLHSRSRTAEALIRRLSARPGVVHVEPNYVVHGALVPNDPRFSDQWALRNTGQIMPPPWYLPGGTAGTPGADISAVTAWDISTGATAYVIGVVDSGIAFNHPDLAANVWSAPADFTVTIGGQRITCLAGSHGFNAINNTCNPMDDNGESHGSSVSGVIGAIGNNNLGVVGVNWVTSMMGLKFLDVNTQGTVANAINAIDFAIQAKAAFGGDGGSANVRVLNNSWGYADFSQELLTEINRANVNNMLFVAAAGNGSRNLDLGPPFYPASFNAPNMITVASTTNTDALSPSSNWGPSTVHLGAPGRDVLSTSRVGRGFQNTDYDLYSGTSIAVPYVSGAVALILSSSACLNTGNLKSTILNNVDGIASLRGMTWKEGRLNVNRASRACRWHHFDMTAVTGAPLPASRVRGYFAGVPRVVYRGFDNHIYEVSIDPISGNWGWFDMTSATGAPAAVGDVMGYFSGTARVVYTGFDNHIHELSIYGLSGWGWFDMTAATGAPGAGGDPFGYDAGTARVVYRQPNGHVVELSIDPGTGSWVWGDMTAWTGGRPAAGNPMGYFSGTARVVYRGFDYHVHELSIYGPDGWGWLDLTAATGAPVTDSEPFGYDAGRARVVYRGIDDHVHELSIYPGWGWFNMTESTRAPRATGNPMGYYGQGARVVYPVPNIYEMTIYGGNGAWGAFDISDATGVPPAAGDPFGYMSNTERVIYVGVDGHLHEFWIQ